MTGRQPLYLLTVLLGWLIVASDAVYDPTKVDWAGVKSACLAVGYEEKRLFNFFTRMCAHDSMATLSEQDCTTPPCGGAGSTAITNATEMIRPENAYDNMANITARAILKISALYSSSVADTLAVCCFVAPHGLNPKVDMFKYTKLKVGKIDNYDANPAGQLPPHDIDTKGFAKFWNDRGFSIKEGCALLGSHSMLDEQACFRGDNNDPDDHCDPFKEPCDDVRMYHFDNHYFVDSCTPDVVMPSDSELPLNEAMVDPPMPAVDPQVIESISKDELCKFTSKTYRTQALERLLEEKQGKRKDPPAGRDNPVFWLNDPAACRDADDLYQKNCPHLNTWPYTDNDGHLAMACQGKKDMGEKYNKEIQYWFDYFAKNQKKWYEAYALALAKMVSHNAKYVANAFEIDGDECPSSYLPTNSRQDKKACADNCGKPGKICPAACSCATSFLKGIRYRRDVAIAKLSKINTDIGDAPARVDILTGTETVDMALVELLIAEAPEPFTELPESTVHASSVVIPDFDPKACPLATDFTNGDDPGCPESDDGAPVYVNGFPSSPFKLYPFEEEYVNPPKKERKEKQCRDDGHCMEAFEIDVYAFKNKMFFDTVPKCKQMNKPAWMLGYDGKYPGPSFLIQSGVEALVRFNNRINQTGEAASSQWQMGYWPCSKRLGKQYDGHPISIHCHGMKSLPPYDGWADDITCSGESKDYIYPNSNPVTAWYHDHAIAQTGPNVWAGLAGFFIVKDGICPTKPANSPYNLADIEPENDLRLMLSDRVLTPDCQLAFYKTGAHRNNLYGDINIISGKPWPNFHFKATTYRLRFVNASPGRPWKVQIKNSEGVDMAQEFCWVIAGDGGYRAEPVKFPFEGLVIGVAERWEVVCDFSLVASEDEKTEFYMWNHRDELVFKNVPYFRYTHLLGKIYLDKKQSSDVVNFDSSSNPPVHHISHVVFQSDYQAAMDMALAGKYHRKMVFGRRKGHWVINGETWDTYKIAADDVGNNMWEVWLLKDGGGWFHPIHVHLVDFIVLFRNNPEVGVRTYEQLTPKDVVFLGPAQKIWVLARFGPHRGDYMFHCHNLVHEDDDMLRAFRVKGTSRFSNDDPPFKQLNYDSKPLYVQNMKFNDPMYGGTAAKKTSAWKKIDDDYVQKKVDSNIYRFFYAKDDDPIKGLREETTNPWHFNCDAVRDADAPVLVPQITTSNSGGGTGTGA